MLEKSNLIALSAVINSGSFEGAALGLHITQSAISQRIKALETALGSPVIIREKPCRPTEIGARLIRHLQDMELIEQATLTEIGLGATASKVRIAVNADSLATWVLPALAATPDSLYDLVIDDQDHSAEWLRTGQVAAAITSRADAVLGCDVHPLGTLNYLATCSPSFKDRHFPNGLNATSFASAPSLSFNAKDGLQKQFVLRECGKHIALPHHHIASTQGFVDATILGLGWGLNPVSLVKNHIKDGALTTLSATPLSTHLYWQVSRLVAGPLQPLTNAIQNAARAVLE